MGKESASGVYSANTSGFIRSVGFPLMLAWHYLILFTPVFSSNYINHNTLDLGSRQLMLYFSLAVGFVLIAVIDHGLAKREESIPFWQKPLLAGIVGLASIAASALNTVSLASDPLAINALTFFLGICQVVMMWIWLLCMFSTHRDYDILREFSSSMMLAGVISLLTCYLQSSVASIVSTLVPATSIIILICGLKSVYAKNAKTNKAQKQGGGGKFGEVKRTSRA